MDHEAVARLNMTERYLLNELDAQERGQFEEHFFDCPECAFDVRAASAFVEQSKSVLAEESANASAPAPMPLPKPAPVNKGWFSWLRPAFAAPALAMLLAIIGYQNLFPKPIKPSVLPYAAVNVAVYGTEVPVITVNKGQGFLLLARIPEGPYTQYTADLHNPSGKVEWSLTIPAVAGQDQWPVQIPGTNREAGTYTMTVRGITSAGDSKEIGSTSFELKIKN
jgi:putative zinc finger protein